MVLRGAYGLDDFFPMECEQVKRMSTLGEKGNVSAYQPHSEIRY